MSKCSQRIITSIREDVTKKALNMPMAFFDSKESGYVTARLSEVANLNVLFSVGNLKAFVSIFEFVSACVILFSMNWKLTLTCLIIAPFLFFITKKNYKELTSLSKNTIEQSSKLNNSIQQTMQGIEDVKNLVGENHESDKINKENNKLYKYSIMQSKKFAAITQNITFFSLLSNVILLLVGSLFVVSGDLTIGTYLTFNNYLGKLYAPIQSLSIMFTTIPPAIVSLNRLIDFLDEYQEEFDDSNKLINSIENISFKNVSFKYPNQEKFIFSNLNINIEQNDKIFISGRNGCGKTSLFRLILGLYPCNLGDIQLNGDNIDIYNRKDLRKHYSIVSQKIFLFGGTVEENIRYGIEISDDEYFRRMKILGLNDFLLNMNISGDYKVVEGGKNLSGGQIQRIAIVRGLCKKADVYLFDEITSNLDKETRCSLENIIKKGFNNKICIFIGHNDDFHSLCNKYINLEEFSV